MNVFTSFHVIRAAERVNLSGTASTMQCRAAFVQSIAGMALAGFSPGSRYPSGNPPLCTKSRAKDYGTGGEGDQGFGHPDPGSLS